MTHHYTLTTERLGLRLLKQDDCNLLMALESDPAVKAYFPDGPRDERITKEMVKRFILTYEKLGLPHFMIFNLQSGEFIGRAGFGKAETNEIEIGYVLHQQHWRKGYASEIATALLEYAKQHIDTEYIIAYADINNTGSFRVMEKCGMTYERTGIAKGIECKFYKISNR